MKRVVLYLFITQIVATLELYAIKKDKTTWIAGVAKVDITPVQPLLLAGYASRTKPATGKLTLLWAKALFIEDAKGKKAILITSDLLGVPKAMSDRIRDRLKVAYGLSREQILFNTSHTHTGPVLEEALVDIYDVDSEQERRISEYSAMLETKIVGLVGSAMKSAMPARIFSQNGVARFQVNRINNKEAGLAEQTELKGPNDFAVPVLKVVSAEENKLMAVSFGYACHPTVLSSNEWSGDYAGFAQSELENVYPGTIAMFFQCTGADQNPLPRRTIGLAKQYGKTLSAAVERVLDEKMTELDPLLSTNYAEIELKLAAPPSKEDLLKIKNESSGYMVRWASRMLDKIESHEGLPKSYKSYPIQVWKLGEQVIVSLGGEVVIEYSINIKKLLGPKTFVLGYSNDVMAYIPSLRILNEGGYEGETSQMVYGLPSKWDPSIEDSILKEVARLAEGIIYE